MSVLYISTTYTSVVYQLFAERMRPAHGKFCSAFGELFGGRWTVEGGLALIVM